jgi:hypothetical protein
VPADNVASPQSICFFGYWLEFDVTDSGAVSTILLLLGAIMSVKTSSVVIKELMNPRSPEFSDWTMDCAPDAVPWIDLKVLRISKEKNSFDSHTSRMAAAKH